MGYGYGKPKSQSHGYPHRWMRYEVSGKFRGGTHSRPVLLRAPLPTDFCCHCGVKREQLEVS